MRRLAAPACLLIMIALGACTPGASVPLTREPMSAASARPMPRDASLWIAPGVPSALRKLAEQTGLPQASSSETATMRLTADTADGSTSMEWIYALVAPFPTVLDGVTGAQLKAVWDGTSREAYATWPLLMTESTRLALAQAWGEPAVPVQTAEQSVLLDRAWENQPSWGVVPFEELLPRWKVIAVDGQSPIRKDFDPRNYPLQVRFGLSGENAGDVTLDLPSSNRDPSKMTTVLLTGTSGLVREIAYQMEVKGITYPARDIGPVLREADIFHTSHETSFDPSCPPPNPLKNRFYCSSPRYLGLFEDVGLDVVELTGNHILDNGTASMLYSLDLYRESGIRYYGGGANVAEAREPLLLEHNGNEIAMMGCIFAEPPEPLAGPTTPGANPCDWRELTRQVSELGQQGYLPIVTLQYKEGYSPVVMPWQLIDFRRAADAGAAIVSGSQSHVPLQMEFYGGAFIHYGLGNLFFGQMANQPPGPGLPLQPAERYEFLDRHVIYDGRHISTELLTAMLEDYARPRPMTSDERAEILRAYFSYSGWLPFEPTPAPMQTPTRYPILKYQPLPTYTPFTKATPRP